LENTSPIHNNQQPPQKSNEQTSICTPIQQISNHHKHKPKGMEHFTTVTPSNPLGLAFPISDLPIHLDEHQGTKGDHISNNFTKMFIFVFLSFFVHNLHKKTHPPSPPIPQDEY
jgi:hypothetical protein